MSEKNQKDARIIMVGSPENFGKREKGVLQRAWEATAGRSILEQRLKDIDELFSPGGLKIRGIGDKTIAYLESSGALGMWRSYVKSTLGGGVMGDRYRITPKNEKGLGYGLAKYQRIRDERTIYNSTSKTVNCKTAALCQALRHPAYCAGRNYQPGEIMFDGQDSPYVQGLAILVLRCMAHQICKSFYSSQVDPEVLAPELPQMPIDPKTGRPMYPYAPLPSDNMGGRRPQAVPPLVQEPKDAD